MNTRSFFALLAFTLVALLTLAGAGAARGADTFALVVLGNGELRRLNLTRGTHTLIRDNSGVYVGLAFNADQTILYGVITPGRTTPSTLVRLDPVTGLPTTLGPVGVAISTVTSLSDGRLFAVGFDNRLYQINPNTGAATLIGSTGLPSLVSGSLANSLASDGAMLYYTLEVPAATPRVVSTLFRLDLATGAASPIGPTGTSDIVGSAYAGPTFGAGQLYAFHDEGYTYAINLTTGAATLLNYHGLRNVYGGVGIIDIVPPTVTLAD